MCFPPPCSLSQPPLLALWASLSGSISLSPYLFLSLDFFFCLSPYLSSLLPGGKCDNLASLGGTLVQPRLQPQEGVLALTACTPCTPAPSQICSSMSFVYTDHLEHISEARNKF